MSHHPVGCGSARLLMFVAALGFASLGCEDDSPGVNADASGGNSGSDPGSLEASSSMGGTGGSGGSAGAGGAGGVGGTAGSAAGGASTATSDGPAAGGSGGTEAEADGSGGSAGGPGFNCAEPDPRCPALGASSACVGYFSTKCEDTNADGCLEFLQENCAPGACQDGDCVPGAASDACGDATSVVGSGFLLAGADFGVDFSDDFEVVGDGCEWPDPAAPEAVLQVPLEAGQTLSVVERGGLDAVVHLQNACAADQACLAASDSVEDEPLEYIATDDETVTVVVESYGNVPNPAWYRIRVDIDPECGNGLLEGIEDCDVGDPATSAGCSEGCLIEFGYQCTDTSPSLCTPVQSLGEFDAADTVEPIVSENRVEVWDEHWRLVTFTEAVVLDLTARSRLMGAGDVNVEIRNESGRVTAYRNTGDETYDAPVGLQPGTYLIRVYVGLTPLPDGYEVNLALRDPGECGDGVLEPALEVCDTDGEPGCTAECNVEFDYSCDVASPTNCTPIESLGTLDSNDTFGPTAISDPIAIGESSYRVFSLSEPAVLSGAVTSNDEVGDPQVWIYSATGGYPYGWENIGDESFTLPVAAGEYKIEVYAHAALEAGYTLTLSTSAP